jgi:hypothetical protein
MDKPTCKTCPYFWREHPDDEIGECRRRAPRYLLALDGTDCDNNWARVYQHQWCGEHPMFDTWIKSKAVHEFDTFDV